MIDVSAINWLAVGGAALAYYLLGALWFAPFSFGPFWDRAIGFDRPAGWKPTPMYYLVPLAGCVFATVAAAVVVESLGLDSVADAVVLGLTLGIGIGATISTVNAITPRMAQPFVYGAVTGAYHSVGITVAAVLLTIWR
jgi:hypothetical protein